MSEKTSPHLAFIDKDYQLISAHWLSWPTRQFFWQFEEAKKLMEEFESRKPYNVRFPKEGEDLLRVKFRVAKNGRFVIEQPEYQMKASGHTYAYPRESLPDGFTLEHERYNIVPGERHSPYYEEMKYEVD